MCTRLYACIYTHVRVCIYTCTYTHVRAYTCKYMYIHALSFCIGSGGRLQTIACVPIYIKLLTHGYVYVCIYVYVPAKMNFPLGMGVGCKIWHAYQSIQNNGQMDVYMYICMHLCVVVYAPVSCCSSVPWLLEHIHTCTDETWLSHCEV